MANPYDQFDSEINPYDQFVGEDPYAQFAKEEEETPPTTFVGGIKDLARIISSPITTGLQAIGTAIGGGLAGQNVLEAAQEGAQKREFLGLDLNTETGAGQAVEKYLGQAFEKIHELGGEGAVDLFRNDVKRAFIKSIPAIGSLGTIYEMMNPEGKAQFEGIVGAGGTVAPDILLTLLPGAKGKVKEKAPEFDLETAIKEAEAAKEPPVYTTQPADLFPETLETPYGTRTGESPTGWTVDENGIPVNRAITSELQRTEMAPTEEVLASGISKVSPKEPTIIPTKETVVEPTPIVEEGIKPTELLGETGFGRGQRGAIGFKQEPTLVEKIQKVPKEEWIAEFNKRYPGKEGIAEQIHSRFYKEPSQLSAGSLNQVVRGLDFALAPISTRLGNIHAELKQGLVNMEAGFTKRMGKDIQTIDPLFTGVNKLGKNQLDAINNSLLNNDYATLRAVVPKELKPEIAKLQTTLKEVGMDLQKYGIVKDLRTEYFPRMVKDLPGLYNKIGADQASQLQDIIRKREGKSGPLSDIELADVTNRYLQGNYAKGGKPGFTRGRVLGEIPPELQKYYYKPTETIHTYLRSAAFQIERAKFFGKDKVIDPATGRIDVSQSIGAKVIQLRNEGKIKPDQVEDVASVLHTRFGAGQQATNTIAQGVKDLIHVVTMGDVGNALMQAADAALLPFSEGIRPTITAVVSSLTKDKLSPKDFGILNHLSEEFISDRPTTKLANVVLAPLSAVDRAAKTLILNAVEQSGRQAAKKGTKGHYLFNEYKDRFGAEFPQLIDDLQSGKRTELTDRFVISELANRQPIFKSEYTQLYLDSPNLARPAMALTSFMIKTGDFMRTRAYNQIKTPGKRVQGIKNLAAISTALVLGQVSMDSIRDFIANRPIEDPREVSKIAGALFGVFRFNEYFSDDIKKGAFGEAAAGLVAPPYKAFDPITKDLVALAFGEEDIYGEKKGFTGKSIKAIPFVGDELYGFSKYGQKERAKLEREQQSEKLKELMK